MQFCQLVATDSDFGFDGVGAVSAVFEEASCLADAKGGAAITFSDISLPSVGCDWPKQVSGVISNHSIMLDVAADCGSAVAFNPRNDTQKPYAKLSMRFNPTNTSKSCPQIPDDSQFITFCLVVGGVIATLIAVPVSVACCRLRGAATERGGSTKELKNPLVDQEEDDEAAKQAPHRLGKGK